MTDAYIYDALRTPRAHVRYGRLASVSPSRLAAATLSEIARRNALDTSCIGDVMLGCTVTSDEQGANVTRTAVLAAGYDYRVPGAQVSRFCASGLEAVNIAAAKILAGQSDSCVAGGIESLSRVPMGSDKGAWQADPVETFSSLYIPQGISADLIATLQGYSRGDVDALAVESHRRAAAAQAEGRFNKSIIPIYDRAGDLLLAADDGVRADATAETMGKLAPSFAELSETAGYRERVRLRYPEVGQIDYMHTAGNSSSIVDGASAVLMGSKQFGERCGLRPRARIVAAGSIGSEPTIMLTGPKDIAEIVLKRAGMTAADVDLYEVNEAFASVVLLFEEAMRVPHDKVNVNGGAIALGHPFGATGGILIGTVLDEMERRNLAVGMVVICVGGGMGTATIIERLP